MNSTYTSDFDLMCDRAHLHPHLQSSLLAGSVLGEVTFGQLQDRIGRRTTILISIAMYTITLVCFVISAYAKNFPAFAASTFVVGLSLGGQCKLPLPMETIDTTHRSYVPPIYGCFWMGGSFIYLATSWYFRDWKLAMITTFSTVIIPSITYYWMIPESPRWLLEHGQNSECVKQLNAIGKVNKREMSHEVQSELTEAHRSNRVTMNTLQLLWRHPAVLIRFLIIAILQ